MSSTSLTEPGTPGPKLAEQVCYALYSTSGIVTQAYAQLLKPHQLTYSQFVVLMGLWQGEGVSVTELGANIGLSKATLTPMLRSLENHGYLQRKRVPGNERTMAITLSRQGREFALKAEAIAQQALCATGLSSAEASQLIALCNKIKSKLGK
ncbi:MAG: MarR family transcriptional regulator [Pseudomonadota bacterium]|nr:MarR family transcriptional regulator [Pseudomonadota bacterium]